ncbi:competence protein CoiA family protein [Rossellomorea vietnamensis]|uniref:competence protein CoiA family protein n=1 Tax=Rossellomorea vietnamensis TaxID=218284 RepID=UPI00077CA5F6|nr:competence protein CoiA family protein [Rossellomorea vietnamensis]
MREALHVIDNEIFKLPYSASNEAVANFKKLAKKELYKCPYCDAVLIVKYGELRGLYFSHQHSEACEESKRVEKAEKRYAKQIERETQLHKVLLDIIYDELSIKSKINPEVYVNRGYKEKTEWKEYPDIYVKLGDKEHALCVITNVNPSGDGNLAQHIMKRHNYFLNEGLEPIWFIEKKEQAIERDKNSIILWEAELTIASKTKEDKNWDNLFTSEIEDEMFFDYFNYPRHDTDSEINTKCLLYILNKEDKIVIHVQRFLKDRIVKPLRAFMINDGYEIPFGQALIVDNGFRLSNPEIEEENRNRFLDSLKQKREQHLERQKLEDEMKKLKLAQEEEMRKVELQEQELRLKKLIDQRKAESINRAMSYEELKQLLREKIGLTQKEQMELWTNYLPRIGLKNSQLVWEIVLENNCRSFTDLKAALGKKYGLL